MRRKSFHGGTRHCAKPLRKRPADDRLGRARCVRRPAGPSHNVSRLSPRTPVRHTWYVVASRATVGSCAAGLVLAVVVSGCGKSGSTVRHAARHRLPAAPPQLADQATSDIQFGTIKSITPLGRGYKLLFDLGIILS